MKLDFYWPTPAGKNREQFFSLVFSFVSSCVVHSANKANSWTTVVQLVGPPYQQVTNFHRNMPMESIVEGFIPKEVNAGHDLIKILR